MGFRFTEYRITKPPHYKNENYKIRYALQSITLWLSFQYLDCIF
jgi:hypothetical protein